MQVSKTLVLEIVAGLGIVTAALPLGVVGVDYSVQVEVTGGVAPYTFSVTDLPEGLSINEAGLISGVPTSAGSFSPTVTVVDSTVV